MPHRFTRFVLLALGAPLVYAGAQQRPPTPPAPRINTAPPPAVPGPKAARGPLNRRPPDHLGEFEIDASVLAPEHPHPDFAGFASDLSLLEAPAALTLRGELTGALAPLVGITAELATVGWTRDQMPPMAWARNDQADSAYRRARELLNQGEYRRAAAAFRDISTKAPSSAYAADAHYWWAFALYRIGGTPELKLALEALETQRAKYPGARTGGDNDALAVRIRGALAARGDAAAAAQIRTAAGDSALKCDREEQAVRVEALNAVTQSDPEGALPMLERVLGRRDVCSQGLRRTAVFLVGSRRNDARATTLINKAARSDPSSEVRGAAIEWLTQTPTDEALGTLEELTKDTDERIAGMAMRALVRHPSARARSVVRAYIERTDVSERLRFEALSAFDKERSTNEDVAWMRGLYAKTDNAKLKARLVNTLSNIGGNDVDQWMIAIARNADESTETRRYAMRRVGAAVAIAELVRLYDTVAERALRESIIDAFGNRAEAEATDKLVDIVKTGTDPQIRRQAIAALTRKKDPRATKLLMELVDR